MEAIRFTAEGLVNSFRRYETATFQNTELTPKKTHIAGLITNIMGRTEHFYYSTLLPSIKIAVVPEYLENIFTDLWQYKKWKGNQGRDVVGRERLYGARYRIFLAAPDDLNQEILEALMHPKRPPALGQDDELIKIKDVEVVDLQRSNEESKVSLNSVFPAEVMSNCVFRLNPEYRGMIIPPRQTVAYLGYTRGPPRKPQGALRITEFFGGYCEGEVEGIDVLTDGEANVVLW